MLEVGRVDAAQVGLGQLLLGAEEAGVDGLRLQLAEGVVMRGDRPSDGADQLAVPLRSRADG
jgi:hypothetical protein